MNILKNNTVLFLITSFVSQLFLILLTFTIDFNTINYSMMTNNVLGYIKVLIFCIFLSINFYIFSLNTNNQYKYLSFGPIVGAITPYFVNTNNLISILHEIFAYVSFGFVCLNTIINLFNIYMYKRKFGKISLIVFFIIFVLDAYLYLNSFGVNAIQEFILLFSIVLIYLINYLLLFANKKSNI